MRGRADAFATLAAVGLLVLTAAMLAGSVLASQQIVVERGRAERSLGSQAAAWKTADTLLSALQATWNPDEQTLDAWWAQHGAEYPDGSTLVSLSARVNLNTMTPFLLQDSELAGTLKGKSVDEFTTYRLNNGPLSGMNDYKDYFAPEALNALYCVYSSFNVNTADEIMLERVVALRTGSDSFASNVRTKVREFRTNRKAMTAADLDMLVGAEKDPLGDLLTVEPELDVNTASVEVLEAILRDPDLNVTQPDAKLQAIVTGRSARPWTADALRQALSVPAGSPILQYLGTRSRFLQAVIHGKTEDMKFVVVVQYSADSPPRITLRVLHTEWDPV